MKKFEDIKITDLNDAATSASGKGSLLNFHLKLSHAPNAKWYDLFDNNWANYFSMSKRSVSHGYGELVVVCLLDELQDQIDAIKPIIVQTNNQYRALLDEQVKKELKDQADKKLQQDKIAEVKKNLKF